MQSNGGNMGIGDKVILSAAIGGTAEALGGGKFSNGAVTGAFVYLLNHASQHGGGKGEKSNSNNSAKGQQGSPSPVIGNSFDITLTMPVGFTFEFGEFIDLATGKSSYFWAFGPAFGVEVSIGLVNGIIIFPESNYNFSDMEGLSAGLSGNKGYFSIAGFTNSKPAIPENTLFESYTGLKIGAGLGLGGSYQPATKTRLVPKSYISSPPANSIFNSNVFFRR